MILLSMSNQKGAPNDTARAVRIQPRTCCGVTSGLLPSDQPTGKPSASSVLMSSSMTSTGFPFDCGF
jgi:hypothetical protein